MPSYYTGCANCPSPGGFPYYNFLLTGGTGDFAVFNGWNWVQAPMSGCGWFSPGTPAPFNLTRILSNRWVFTGTSGTTDFNYLATVSDCVTTPTWTFGTSSGTGTVPTIAFWGGSFVPAGDGSASGTAVVSGVGTGLFPGTGTIAGTSTVIGAAFSTARATGTIAGTSTVVGVGVPTARATGTIAGTSTVFASPSFTGVISGTAVVTGIDASAYQPIARASGFAFVAGVGRSVALGVGTATGFAGVAAVSEIVPVPTGKGILTDTAKLECLKKMRPIFEQWSVVLCNSVPATITQKTTFWDIAEATFAGYARQPITAVGAPVLDGLGHAEIAAQALFFQNKSKRAVTLDGWGYCRNNFNPVMRAIGRFIPPVTVLAGSFISFAPVLQDTSKG